MCPSYMVTREEKHSTRGRARMLFEMMNGEVIDDGWKSEEVKDALDLCLSCKGCKGDCPVNVDMATYKAEFLSHYYEGRLRPRHAYAFGWIHIWSTLASFAPSLANLLHADARAAARSPSSLAGVHPKRQDSAVRAAVVQAVVPSRTSRRHPGGPPVVLFADTFNNHFHPDVAIAATEVLEDAGFRVAGADGRRLLRAAALRLRLSRHGQALVDRHARQAAAVLSGPAFRWSCWSRAAGRRSRMNCPTCCPNSEDAKRLKALTFTLSDFLRSKAPHYSAPEAAPQGDRPRPLPSEGAGRAERQGVRQAVRGEGNLRQDGHRAPTPRRRLLRHGRRVRLRKGKRPLRSRRRLRRARAAAGSAQRRRRRADHRRRLQLPGADRAADRPPGAAPGAGARRPPSATAAGSGAGPAAGRRRRSWPGASGSTASPPPAPPCCSAPARWRGAAVHSPADGSPAGGGAAISRVYREQHAGSGSVNRPGRPGRPGIRRRTLDRIFGAAHVRRCGAATSGPPWS